jgi:catecholate siderophore receptor
MFRRSDRPTRKAVALLAVICFSGLWLVQGARVDAASSSASAAASPPTYRFDIPAGPLESALSQFTRLTGVSVTTPTGTTVEGLATPGVSGVYTADHALLQLLAGTGFTARLTRVGEYTLEVRVTAEQVEVTGQIADRGQATVTATKTYTPLRDVPQAVTVITHATIAEQSMQSMADVVRYVPGIGMAQGEGNRDTAIFRGNSSTSDFFVDGVRDDVQYFRDLYNVERIEALKGPNAMIFGRGGAGGVINRATRQADWTSTHEATVQLGSFDNRRATIDIGQRLGSAAAARVTALYENSGSYRDGAELERYGINPTFAVSLTPSTVVRVGYEYFHDERTADRGIPSFQGTPFRTDPSTFFGDPAQSPTGVTVNALTAGLEHRFAGGLMLRNRTRFADYAKFYQNVYANNAVRDDGQSASIGAYNNATDRQNLFNQTDLNLMATTGAIRHTLLVGAEFGRQATDNLRHTGYFGEDLTSVIVPVVAPRVTTPVAFRQSATDADNHGIAIASSVYAQDQIAFSRHLQAVVGLRYDNFQVDFRNNRTGALLTSEDHLLAPRAGFIVKPADSLSLYTSYSLAYVPRAGEQLSSLSLSTAALEPEQFRNYELGAKWDARPDLSLTAAIYRLDRTNVVIPDPVDPTRSTLVDGQRTSGLELGIMGRVTSAWRVMGAYAYQDGTITQDLSSTVHAGASLAQLPAHTFSLWNRYDFNRTWGAAVGVVHRGEMFASTDNAVTLPGFTRADAAVFVNLTPRLRAQVNVENIFDEIYYASAHNNFNITPGSPRAVRVALTTSF